MSACLMHSTDLLGPRQPTHGVKTLGGLRAVPKG